MQAGHLYITANAGGAGLQHLPHRPSRAPSPVGAFAGQVDLLLALVFCWFLFTDKAAEGATRCSAACSCQRLHKLLAS